MMILKEDSHEMLSAKSTIHTIGEYYLYLWLCRGEAKKRANSWKSRRVVILS